MVEECRNDDEIRKAMKQLVEMHGEMTASSEKIKVLKCAENEMRVRNDTTFL